MEGLTQFASVPIIVAVVYFAMALYKYAIGDKEKWKKMIPVFAGLLGAILGVFCFYQIPDIMPNANVLVALVTGGVSGLGAVGVNQMSKQLKTKTEETKETKD